MNGTRLLRTVFLALCVLCWAALARAQSAPDEETSAEAPSDVWFRIEELNLGLPPAPPELDRDTPMGAVESFLAAIRAGRPDRAAHLLELSRIPVDQQAEQGPQLAAKLGTLIQNDIWIDWSDLPDRPDAIVESVTGNNPMAGQGRWAYVEAIFYTHVRLRTWDERRLIVPVQYLLSRPFENYSIVDKKMTRVFVLTIDPRADVEELREAYLAIACADEDVMQEEVLKALVIDQNHNGMVVRFYLTAKDPSAAWNAHCRLREKTLAWIRDHHPEWWPRQRELQESHGATRAPSCAT